MMMLKAALYIDTDCPRFMFLLFNLHQLLMLEMFNQFQAIGHFLYPLKTSENLWFYISRGYKKETVVQHEQIH